jgi:hypothetical protein
VRPSNSNPYKDIHDPAIQYSWDIDSFHSIHSDHLIPPDPILLTRFQGLDAERVPLRCVCASFSVPIVRFQPFFLDLTDPFPHFPIQLVGAAGLSVMDMT